MHRFSPFPAAPRLAAAVLLLAPLVPPVQAAPQDVAGPPARALLLELTEEARLAGTTGSLRAARMVARHLVAAGFEVELDERAVLLSLPRRVVVGLYSDSIATAPFSERRERFDPDAIPPGDIPPFNAWSASGDVRGAVVDCGYGTRADFERLAAARVDLAGKIALCRYGQGYRGIKVELATEFGCTGVLLFSDPSDDGAERGATWPAGPWKPDWAVQRGSIAPMGRAPGDPSTPGFPSPAPGGESARPRLSSEELYALLPRIPCTPIPAREAAAIRARLATKRIAQADGTKVSVQVGPGPVEVRIIVDAPREVRTIRNVIGRLRGVSEDVVIAGNHRDAWVRGANDAGGGTVALLRAAQRLGERVKAGWKPRYSIAIAFWDAEEQGLIGSTEWGEANAGWLREHALVYVNADVAVSGTRFGASGTPGLLGVLAHSLARVPAPDPANGDAARTLWQQWLESTEGAPQLGLPGSGSDFAVFLHHLSLPVVDISFRGNRGGQYHTAFDDFLQVERTLDPGFIGHELAGRFLAVLLEDLATLGRLAFDDSEAATEMARHARASESWLGAERAEALSAAFDRLATAAAVPERERLLALDALIAPGAPAGVIAIATSAEIERELAQRPIATFYSALELREGLADRPWFKNRLWAPGLETGYGAETFPTLRAAVALGSEALDAEHALLLDAVHALRTEWEQADER